MSARLARSAFQAAGRRAAFAPRTSGRRGMATDAHGAVKSDTPWLVGSALVFGPALLYLLSPTARQHTPAIHDDKRQYPGLKTHERLPSFTEPKNRVIIKDDDGTPADVTASIALSEEANSPKGDVSDDKWEATLKAAEAAVATPVTGSEAAATGSDSIGKSDRSGDFQPAGSEGPVDEKPARSAAKEGTTPLADRKQKEEAKA